MSTKKLKFLEYLSQIGIIDSKQQLKFQEQINSNTKIIFQIADFLKKLTPSDCFDISARMYSIWEEQNN